MCVCAPRHPEQRHIWWRPRWDGDCEGHRHVFAVWTSPGALFWQGKPWYETQYLSFEMVMRSFPVFKGCIAVKLGDFMNCSTCSNACFHSLTHYIHISYDYLSKIVIGLIFCERVLAFIQRFEGEWYFVSRCNLKISQILSWGPCASTKRFNASACWVFLGSCEWEINLKNPPKWPETLSRFVHVEVAVLCFCMSAAVCVCVCLSLSIWIANIYNPLLRLSDLCFDWLPSLSRFTSVTFPTKKWWDWASWRGNTHSLTRTHTQIHTFTSNPPAATVAVCFWC